jgi:hypothetical protein
VRSSDEILLSRPEGPIFEIAEITTCATEKIEKSKPVLEIVILTAPSFVVVTEAIDQVPVLPSHSNYSSSIFSIWWQPTIALYLA